uniref:Uncharacterized protein n=1 Tax=Physcomitrium patens TaxID=3218 RepID=A0A2K1JLM6_PHYPA|nr:hypothetical protein PHYPA_017277 [Physcomitrium patens]
MTVYRNVVRITSNWRLGNTLRRMFLIQNYTRAWKPHARRRSCGTLVFISNGEKRECAKWVWSGRWDPKTVTRPPGRWEGGDTVVYDPHPWHLYFHPSNLKLT